MTAETETRTLPDAETLAREFHAAYERLAPEFDYRTREASAVPWEDVPENNRRLMVATCGTILALFTPRVISTPAERASLPTGTVVRSASGTIACRHHDENVGVLFGMSTPFKWSDLSLPLTVLHLPA